MTKLNEAIDAIGINDDDAWSAFVQKYNENPRDYVIAKAKAWAELERRVEAGECKVVPCEATNEMIIALCDTYIDQQVLEVPFHEVYKTALQGAPDLMKEIEGEIL